MIEGAKLKDISNDVRDKLQRISNHVRYASGLRKKSRRFLVSPHTDITGEFNVEVYLDVLSLLDGNGLRVLERGTGFQSRSFLERMKPVHTWRALRRFWIEAYTGLPDLWVMGQGSNFTSDAFVQSGAEIGKSAHTVLEKYSGMAE